MERALKSARKSLSDDDADTQRRKRQTRELRHRDLVVQHEGSGLQVTVTLKHCRTGRPASYGMGTNLTEAIDAALDNLEF
jgi:hypothetical protein